MHQSRTYPFSTSYSGTQDPSHEDGTQFPTSEPLYHRGYSQQQGAGPYYVQEDEDGMDCRPEVSTLMC